MADSLRRFAAAGRDWRPRRGAAATANLSGSEAQRTAQSRTSAARARRPHRGQEPRVPGRSQHGARVPTLHVSVCALGGTSSPRNVKELPHRGTNRARDATHGANSGHDAPHLPPRNEPSHARRKHTIRLRKRARRPVPPASAAAAPFAKHRECGHTCQHAATREGGARSATKHRCRRARRPRYLPAAKRTAPAHGHTTDEAQHRHRRPPPRR